MSVPAKERRKSPLLPPWAYVVMNLAFLATCVVVYLFAQSHAATSKPPVPSVGMLPLMVVSYVFFTLVCLYDFWLDRRAERERRQRPDVEVVDMMMSQEKTRRVD